MLIAQPRCFLLLVLTAIACTLPACEKSPAAESPERAAEPRQREPDAPSLLFISLDTTRADHLGCYGYERPTSPEIDKLAARSHRFENAYTVMPSTLPSHTAMVTSLNPAQLTVLRNGQTVPPEAHTLAERLKEHGFATAAFVAAAPLHRSSGFDQGFNTYAYPDEGHWSAEQVSEQVIPWLGQRGDERFFCFVHMYDPHTWYEPLPQFAEEFGVAEGKYPPKRGFLNRHKLSRRDRTDAINAYDAEIKAADTQIGRILDALEQSGQAHKTLVVFISDHGETHDEIIEKFGYAFDHGEFLYRRELRIPCLLHLPGETPQTAAVHAEPVSTLDLMPTILDWLAVPCDSPVAGRSLRSLLEGGTLPPRPIVAERHVMTERELDNPLQQGASFAVIDGNWHWIQATGRDDELYDMSQDPGEQTNVVADNREQAKKLAAILVEWTKTSRTPAWGQDAVDVDDSALLHELESLGYLGGGEEP